MKLKLKKLKQNWSLVDKDRLQFDLQRHLKVREHR